MPMHWPGWGDTGNTQPLGSWKPHRPVPRTSAGLQLKICPQSTMPGGLRPGQQRSATESPSRPGSWRLVSHLIGLPTVGLSVHLLTYCPHLLCGLAQTGVEQAMQGLMGQEGEQ